MIQYNDNKKKHVDDFFFEIPFKIYDEKDTNNIENHDTFLFNTKEDTSIVKENKSLQTTRFDNLKETIVNLKNENEYKTKIIRELEETISNKMKTIDKLEQIIINKTQSINQFEETISNKIQIIDQLKESLNDKKQIIDQLKETLNDKKEIIDHLKETIRNNGGQIKTSTIQKQINSVETLNANYF